MKEVKCNEKVLTIIMLVSMILVFCFFVIHLNHSCSHDNNCPICSFMYKFKENLNGFNPNISEIIIMILPFSFLFIICLRHRITDKNKYTLVGLKVELIN